jgi:cytochrome c-type biogenesis protein CcmH/NrfG
MGPLGKRIVVFTMMWVLLVMVLTQLYDNVTGRGMPPRIEPTPTAQSTQPDPGVTRLAELQSCIASNPDNLQCNVDLAAYYYEKQRWDQAQALYERAIRLDPHNVAVLVRLAGTYIYQQKFDQAVTSLRQAASLQPDSPEIHLLLGLSLSRLDPPRTDEAVAEWRRVIELAPGSKWAAQAAQYINEAGGR